MEAKWKRCAAILMNGPINNLPAEIDRKIENGWLQIVVLHETFF